MSSLSSLGRIFEWEMCIYLSPPELRTLVAGLTLPTLSDVDVCLDNEAVIGRGSGFATRSAGRSESWLALDCGRLGGLSGSSLDICYLLLHM